MQPLVEPEVLAAMRRHARTAWPDEAVGALLGHRGSGARAVAYAPLGNRAADPRTAFVVDPVELAVVDGAARDRGLALLGLFHSHPDGDAAPSARDRAAAWPGDFAWVGRVDAHGGFAVAAHRLTGARLAQVAARDQKRIV